MMPSVSGHRCSPEFSMVVAPPSPARKIIAAAPSPNRLVATILALVSSSSRIASEQSSTATSSTLLPGRASARRDAIDRPETPPAQPRPNTGTRLTSERNPRRPATRASRLGVAIPVEQTVTTVSMSAPVSCALASAFSAASMNSASAPSRKAFVRSGQPRRSRYHSNGFTPCRLMIPVLEKMLDRVSNCGSREPNTSHAAARTSFCNSTWGGSEVASDTKAAFGFKAATGIGHLSAGFTLGIRNIHVAGIFRHRGRKVSLKGDAHARCAAGPILQASSAISGPSRGVTCCALMATQELGNKPCQTASAVQAAGIVSRKGGSALEQPGRTMLDKIWDQHVIFKVSDDTDLLHVDRHLLHDLGGSRGLLDLKSRNLAVHSPELTFATPDHAISSAPGRAGTSKIGLELLASLRVETTASGIQLFDVDQPGQGIVHVIGPELGLSLPGSLIVCGDSHTCTHGGLGALAFGIGSSELTHVLATQALIQRRPKTMRVKFEGKLPLGVTAKDMILALIGHAGVAAGTGYAVEYAGSAIRDLPVEGRFTICNLSIEFGAKMGMVAPDEKTYEYIKGRRYAPEGAMWEQALAAWKQLPSDANAVFDKEITIDVTKIKPQVTWGISPEHVIGVDDNIPDPKA